MQYLAWPRSEDERAKRRCRDRGRRDRRQRVRLFSEHRWRVSGRRIVLIERDPSYAKPSTARSAGGLRQQFSTPENIAMSQFTLSLFRSTQIDVRARRRRRLSRAGLPDHGDRRRSRDSGGERRAAAVAWAPTSCCWMPRRWRAGFPGLRRRASLPPASAESGEGWFDPPSLAGLLRNAARRAASRAA